MPVIIFSNTDIETYQRVVSSRYIKKLINIFKFEDFEKMLETVVMPYDILNYLAYRTVFTEFERGKVIVDNADDQTAIIACPQNEKEYAELFLARSYIPELCKYDIQEKEIESCNEIVSSLNETNGFKKCKFIEGLMHTNYIGAARIVKNWSKLVSAAQQERFVTPFWISDEGRLYLFAAQPNSMPDNEYMHRVNLCVAYRKNKDNINFLHLLTIRNEGVELYSVLLSDANLEENFPYKELIKDAVKLFEE